MFADSEAGRPSPDAVPGTPGFDPERLREALAKASPRPWRWDDGKRSMRLYAGAKQLLKAPKDGHCAPVETGGCGVDIFAAYWPEPADAALIVEAVNSVPSLLDTLARQERVVEAARATDHSECENFPPGSRLDCTQEPPEGWGITINPCLFCALRALDREAR